MATELAGVLFDNTQTPWAPMPGFAIKAYSASTGVMEGVTDTDAFGRFHLFGLSDRDDWVPRCVTSTKGVIIPEAIDASEILLAVAAAEYVSMQRIEVGGVASIEGFPINYVDDYDKLVDRDYGGEHPNVHTTLAAAIAGGGTSIFVRLMVDEPAPVTIVAADNVQRFQGKDADTTETPVNVTVWKDDVTIEQLKFLDAILSIGLSTKPGDGCTVKECLFSGTGQLVLAGGSTKRFTRVSGCRFDGITIDEPILVDAVDILIDSCRFSGNTGAHEISRVGALSRLTVKNCLFESTALTGHSVELGAAGTACQWAKIEGCTWYAVGGAKGAIHLIGLRNHVVNCTFYGYGNATTAALFVEASTGGKSDSLVDGCNFYGTDGTYLLLAFGNGGADANLVGTRVKNCTFQLGTVKCSPNIVFEGCSFGNATVDMNNAAGLVFIDCDFTNATIVNRPADVVMWLCKGGQLSAGDWLAPRASGYQGAAQSISNFAWVPIQFNTENYDNDTIHDNSTNNTRWTVQRSGVYHIEGIVAYAAHATGERWAAIKKNGTTFMRYAIIKNSGGVFSDYIGVSCDLDLVAGDYVELMAFQWSGGNLNTVNGANGTVLEIRKAT